MRKQKRRLSIIVSVLLLAVMIAGCGGKSDDKGSDKEGSKTEKKDDGKKIKIGFAIRTQDSPYYVKLAETVEKLSKEAGWECTVLDSGGDAAKETESMETFMSQGMDLIFLDCIDPNACIPSINAAAEQNIGVINLDSGVGEGAKDVTTVYSNNLQNGRLVGLAYVDKVGKDDAIKAIMLSGGKGEVGGQERRTGLFCGIIEGRTGISEDDAWKAAEKFNDELTEKGKAENKDANFIVAGQGWGAWTEEGGLEAAEDLITANKDLTCVLGENDQMLFGAMTALDNSGIKNVDVLAAADGAQRAYDLIKEGKYFATGENSPVKVAQKGMEIAKEILIDKKDPWGYEDVTLTEAVAVTKEKVDEYYEYGF